MAEIKSAIELAMERTRNLVLDEEEKKVLALKDTESKIEAVLRRYFEGMIDKEAAEKELGEIKGDDVTKRSLLVDLLVEQFVIRSGNERFFDLIGLVCGGLPESLRNELDTIQKRFMEQMERKEILIRQEVLEKLEKEGISGTALEPHLEAWDEWKEGLDQTRNIFKTRLNEWKKGLKASC